MRARVAHFVAVSYFDRSQEEATVTGIFLRRSDAARFAASDERNLTDPFEWNHARPPQIGETVQIVDNAIAPKPVGRIQRFLNDIRRVEESKKLASELASMADFNDQLQAMLKNSESAKLNREHLEARVRDVNNELLGIYQPHSIDGGQIRGLAVSKSLDEARDRMVNDFVRTFDRNPVGNIGAAKTDRQVSELNRAIQQRVKRFTNDSRTNSTIECGDEYFLLMDRILFCRTQDGIRAGDMGHVIGIDRSTRTISVALDRSLGSHPTTVSLEERTDLRLAYVVPFEFVPAIKITSLMVFASIGHGASNVVSAANAHRIYVYTDEPTARTEFNKYLPENQYLFESKHQDPLFTHIREVS